MMEFSVFDVNFDVSHMFLLLYVVSFALFCWESVKYSKQWKAYK